jgi:hypothetical protein
MPIIPLWSKVYGGKMALWDGMVLMIMMKLEKVG